MINVQQVQNYDMTTQSLSQQEQNASSTVQVNVVDQMGNNINSYSMTGNNGSTIANNLKSQSGVIEVLVNGKAMSMAQARALTFGQAGNTITVVENGTMGINSSYSINGNVYAIGQTNGDYVSQTGAKIYVPSNVLKENTLSSVEINGVDYTGKIEGNYVVVNGEIPAIAADANNVVVRFHHDHVMPGRGVSQANTGKASVQVIQMNQYGQELATQTINNANGYSLLPVFSNLEGEVTSITYNGANATVMDLLTQAYENGTSNVLIITEHTNSPIQLSASFMGHQIGVPLNNSDSITANGVHLDIPTGLLRNFNVSSVTINGVEYTGKLEGNTYVVNDFIPGAVEYNTVINLLRK